jgi:hypothetical protein
MTSVDPYREYLLRAVLALFDPRPGDAALPYTDMLWRLQALHGSYAGAGAQARGKPIPPEAGATLTPDEERAVREALRYLDPHADDRYMPQIIVAHRLLRAIDRELSVWTSAPHQGLHGTGTVAMAPPPPVG